ncbi:hypothetical protein BGZ99_004189 [Dissophora globulifera]|uniref:Uncharacterized protein n=1 Tax=Dissophora globulifera TaxID=979702 RepID=A0A9P6RTD5_9FUNG|nr:hypothetical protein BGZ99_004189 [Dissophora globulifera]
MSTGMTSPTSGMLSPQASGLQTPSNNLLNLVHQDSVPVVIVKRCATWRYMQRIHQGGMVLYNTAMLSEMDLRRGYSDEKTQRRAMQYFLLGTSLATILEIPSPIDCLKALNLVVQEATSRRNVLDVKSIEETGEYSLLEVRQLPFNLDYVITFTSLCDMIAQVYEKLSMDDRMWNMATIEMFQKIDNRFKKILAVVSKELETMARDVMLDELNAMDPLGTAQDHEWDI